MDLLQFIFKVNSLGPSKVFVVNVIALNVCTNFIWQLLHNYGKLQVGKNRPNLFVITGMVYVVHCHFRYNRVLYNRIC